MTTTNSTKVPDAVALTGAQVQFLQHAGRLGVIEVPPPTVPMAIGLETLGLLTKPTSLQLTSYAECDDGDMLFVITDLGLRWAFASESLTRKFKRSPERQLWRLKSRGENP